MLIVKAQLLEALYERFAKKRYYRMKQFWKASRLLYRSYWRNNPYMITRKYDEQLMYGETPIILYEYLLSPWIKEHNRIYEIGCGVGRGLFFLSERFSVQVIGVECVDHFVKRIREVVGQTGAFIEVVHGKADQIDYLPALFYVYCTGWDEQELYRICAKIPPGSTVVSISEDISEIHPHFESIYQKTALFPWGEADVFVCRYVTEVAPSFK